jgi:CRP-like cAMP-binding protein
MSKLSTETYKMGEVIFHEKSQSEALYIIQTGQVEVYKRAKDGAKVVIAIVNSGQYLGEMALLRAMPHSSSAAALSEVTAIKVPREAVESQLKSAPSWLVALLRLLVSRLHSANELIKKHGVVDEATQTAAHAIADNAKKLADEDAKEHGKTPAAGARGSSSNGKIPA